MISPVNGFRDLKRIILKCNFMLRPWSNFEVIELQAIPLTPVSTGKNIGMSFTKSMKNLKK